MPSRILDRPMLPDKVENMVEGVIYRGKNYARFTLVHCIDCDKSMSVPFYSDKPKWIRCRDCENKRRPKNPLLPEKFEDIEEGVIYKDKRGKACALHHCETCGKASVIYLIHGEFQYKICRACAMRTPEKREAMRNAHLGVGWSDEHKKMMSEFMKNKWETNEAFKARMKEITDSYKGIHRSEETKSKLSKANKGQKHPPGQDEAHSKRMKEMYKDPEYKDSVIEKLFAVLPLRPTKPEKQLDKILQEHFPNQWIYNGDNSCHFKIDGKVPDFLSLNNLPLVIEVFGFHHCPAIWKHIKPNAIAKNRVELFKEFGYDTLIIWQPELEKPELVVQKIQDFMRAS